MSGGDGVEVSGEVQVDVLHGHHLGIAAPGSAPLEAEAGSQGRLPQSHAHFFPHAVQGICQSHAGGSLALPCRGGVDGGHQHQLAILPVLYLLPDLRGELGLVLAVQLQIVLRQSQFCGNLLDRLHLGFLCNFHIGFHGISS